MGQPADILREYVGPGDVLAGRFQIDCEIGSGAYGAIYLADDLENGHQLAIKALPPQGQGTSETAIGRFERELKVVRNLNHPSIVQVVAYGETDEGVLYMVMEFIDGETLEQKVLAREGFDIDVALSVTRQIASALHLAHQSGVIHRDLKPANIMLTASAAGYNVKVLDFGMAKLSARLGDESIVSLTRDGMAVGTPRYIAPEQARGSTDIGPWTDVYALGLLLYEMLTAQKAVQHDSVESAVTEHVDPSPLELPGLGEFPDPVQGLVRQMIHKEIDARMPSAADVVEAVDEMAHMPFAAPEQGGSQDVVGPPLGDAEGMADGGRVAGERARAASEAVAAAERDSELEAYPDELEVEWRDPTAAGTRSRNAPPGRRSPGWRRRIAHLALTAGAIAATGFVALVSFMVIAAQARGLGEFVRAGLGAAPVLLAALSLVGQSEGEPARHLLRNCVIYSGIGFVAAHLVGPMRLARGLWHDPVWFLEALNHALPGVGLLASFLGWLGESYALFLVSLFGSGSGVGP